MFLPQSFFFTDATNVDQSESQSFGPKSVDVFDLTSRFQSSGGMAYALCKGVVLIQPNAGGADRVNLVLRPFGQPITGFNIRYIVYRGLLKGDFFNGNNVLPADTAQSDFIKGINTAYDSFYETKNLDKPAFTADFIGYDVENQPSSMLVDRLFFKESLVSESHGVISESGGAFELPMVHGGNSLGRFADGECGIDVVLSYGDYYLEKPMDEFIFDLNYVRKAYVRLDVTGLSDEPGKKRIREQVCQFIDIAAFYGFHVEHGVVNVPVNGGVNRYKGQEIYQQVVGRFHSRNRLYLYIQSDRGRSYDFYGNYSLPAAELHNMKIGTDADGLSATAFGSYGWPVHIVDGSAGRGQDRFSIQLQLVSDGNPETMLYLQAGNLVNGTKNNFMDARALKVSIDGASEGTRAYTPSIILSAPHSQGGTNDGIASFYKLIYQGVTLDYVGTAADEDSQSVTAIYTRNFFDDVFESPHALPLIKSPEQNTGSLALQRLKLVSYIQDGQQKGIMAVQCIRVYDRILRDGDPQAGTDRVTYVSEQVDVLNNPLSYDANISVDSSGHPSMGSVPGMGGTFRLPPPFGYDVSEFSAFDQTVRGIRLTATDGTIPIKIIVGLTKAEHDSLISLIPTNMLNNPSLFLADHGPINAYISPEGIPYKMYRIAVTGEDGNNRPGLYFPATEIILYSIDDNFHLSPGYSQLMTADPQLFTNKPIFTRTIR